MDKNATGDLLFKQARLLDSQGDEAEAIPLYRKAIARGLSQQDKLDALIGLGSSLTATGDHSSAIRTLRKARLLSPANSAIILFLALAHHHAGQSKLAIRQLADGLLRESKHPSLFSYRRPLTRKFHAVR